MVTLRWEETGEESLQELLDIQPDGSGRLDWVAVEKEFCADVVKIAGGATPTVFNQEDASKGLTRTLFQPGSTVFIDVTRKAQGTIPHSAAAYFSLGRLRRGLYRVPPQLMTCCDKLYGATCDRN